MIRTNAAARMSMLVQAILLTVLLCTVVYSYGPPETRDGLHQLVQWLKKGE